MSRMDGHMDVYFYLHVLFLRSQKDTLVFLVYTSVSFSCTSASLACDCLLLVCLLLPAQTGIVCF